MNEETGIYYDLIQPSDAKGLVDLIQETFPEREPMAVALQLSRADYLPYTDLVVAKAVRDRLTVVARLKGANRLLGFCIAEDYFGSPVYSLEKVNQRMLPLLHLLETLDRQGPIPRRTREIYHLYMLGVAPDYARLGIGRGLLQRSLKLGSENGFQSAIAEATGPYSQRLCASLGFAERAALSYEGYTVSGQAVFEGIRAASGCKLFQLNLCQDD